MGAIFHVSLEMKLDINHDSTGSLCDILFFQNKESSRKLQRNVLIIPVAHSVLPWNNAFWPTAVVGEADNSTII